MRPIPLLLTTPAVGGRVRRLVALPRKGALSSSFVNHKNQDQDLRHHRRQRRPSSSLSHYAATPSLFSDTITTTTVPLAQKSQKRCAATQRTAGLHTSSIVAAAAATAARRAFSLRQLAKRARSGKNPLTMMTTYDYPSALLAQRAGFDLLLVGDSLGNVVLGLDRTSAVTLNDMIHHTRAVVRACDRYQGSEHRPLVVGDVPFGCARTPDIALDTCVRLVQEGGADLVKIEGGRAQAAEQVAAVTAAGIPVIGHVGLTPQTATALGGFGAQGRDPAAAIGILDDACALRDAGCCAVVLEHVPAELALDITLRAGVPTIGIGAGAGTSGQVLVMHDVLGLFGSDAYIPSFAKRYADAGDVMAQALTQLRQDFDTRSFPGHKHSSHMTEEALQIYRSQAEAIAPLIGDDGGGDGGGGGGGGDGGSGGNIAGGGGDDAGGNNGSGVGSSVSIDGGSSSSTASKESTTATAASAATDGTALYLRQSGTRPHPRRIAVIGGGAMGSLISAKLADQSDNKVYMITNWTEHMSAVNTTGLRLEIGSMDDCKGPQHHHIPAGTVRALAPSQVDLLTSAGGVDLVFVCVKSPQTHFAAALAAELVRPAGNRGAIVTLQNGAGHLETLLNAVHCANRSSSSVDDSRSSSSSAAATSTLLAAAVTNQGAKVLGPGRVAHTGTAGLTYFCETDGEAAHTAADVLTAAGLPVEQLAGTAARESLLWGKLLVNAAINPLTAILRSRNGALLDAEGMLSGNIGRAASALATEAAAVAHATGATLPYDNPLERVAQVLQVTAPNTSSMLADIQRGVETEIAAINGHIVTTGATHNVPTPVNKAIVDLVQKGSRLKPIDLPHALGLGGTERGACAGRGLSSKDRHLRQRPHDDMIARGLVTVAAGSPALIAASAASSPPPTGSRTGAAIHRCYAGRGSNNAMLVHQTPTDFYAWRNSLPQGARVGFVPTMGGLHDGHLSLIEAARASCDVVTASIFVNPTQFAAHEDLDAYPRTKEKDLAMLEQAGTDAVLLPDPEDLYPNLRSQQQQQQLQRCQQGPLSVSLSVHGTSSLSEGASRPHFFDGVATVLTKLYNITRPDAVFFGQKDAEQCVVARQMVADMLIPTEVCVVETMREPDGLAMSTRNWLLGPGERAMAPQLHTSLQCVAAAVRDGERNVDTLRELGRSELMRYDPNGDNWRLDYIDFFCAHTATRPGEFLPNDACSATSSTAATAAAASETRSGANEYGHHSTQMVVAGAAWLGKTRLIDNIFL